MAWITLTEESAGAPLVRAVNGHLNALLRWALPQLGWSIAFDDNATATVFKNGGASGHVLMCHHNSSITGNPAFALIRAGIEATSATAVTGTFPTTTQMSNAQSVWKIGSMHDSSIAGRFFIAGNEKGFYLFTDDINYGWDWYYFGEVPTDYPSTYATILRVRNSATTPTNYWQTHFPYPEFSTNTAFWARGVNGTTVSTRATFDGRGYPAGQVAGLPPMRGGYQNAIVRERVGIHCTGLATQTTGPLSLVRRGWMPNLWQAVHNGMGGVNPEDTFTDTDYNPAAVFKVFNTPNYGNIILEITDTWVKP